MSVAEKPGNSRSVVWLAVIVEGGLIVLAWLTGWLLNHPPLDTFHFSWLDALWGVLATLPLLALFLACLRWPIGPLREIKQFVDMLWPMFASCTLLDLAGIAVLAGLGEEMLFRGVFQSGVSSYSGSWIAGLALASILFGLCHAVTRTYAVLATVMGAYLGGLYLLTQNLMPAVLAHALYDFVALVILFRLRKPPVEVLHPPQTEGDPPDSGREGIEREQPKE